MNYCRKCESDYEKPGTCNCFAEQAPRQAAPPVYVPYVPYPAYTPWWTTPHWYGSGTSVTLTPGTLTGNSGATIMWNGPITGGSVSYEQAVKSSAGGSC